MVNQLWATFSYFFLFVMEKEVKCWQIWFWPANGVQSNCLIVKIHNTWVMQCLILRIISSFVGKIVLCKNSTIWKLGNWTEQYSKEPKNWMVTLLRLTLKFKHVSLKMFNTIFQLIGLPLNSTIRFPVPLVFSQVLLPMDVQLPKT